MRLLNFYAEGSRVHAACARCAGIIMMCAGQKTPYGQPVLYSTMAQVWQQVLQKSDYVNRVAAVQAFNAVPARCCGALG